MRPAATAADSLGPSLPQDLTDLLERKLPPKEPKEPKARKSSTNKPGPSQGREGWSEAPGKAKARGTGSSRHASSNGSPGKRRG